MRRRIVVNRDVCSGCRACQVACVAHHEGVFGTATARIRVVKTEHLGVDEPVVCRQCARPACVAACPEAALHRDERTGAILLSAAACTGCGACVDACPFGVPHLHPRTHLVLICDLCGGDPACVRRCATGAIAYGEVGGPVPSPATREKGAARG